MRFYLIALFVLGLLFSGSIAAADTVQDYCKKEFKKNYQTRQACVNAEEAAREWLGSRPVDNAILYDCKRAQMDNKHESYVITKRCVEEESERLYRRSVSPYNMENSTQWYVPTLKKVYPSVVRACGVDRPVDSFAVLPRDITRFNISTRLMQKNMLPVLRVSGTVKIGALPKAFSAGKVQGKKGYLIYIDAFLITGDGRSEDVQSTATVKPVGDAGGTVRFSFDIGSGYYFDKGGSLLVVASGNPIKSDYPAEPCVMIGAKKLRFKKK
ncbi:MAG: hypothetical protein BMS9Abin23_0458 [Thermodesulfobacteriota bacterium]|nr:MAG: hypothetical protein BMS9Abin23_0458 [Thermodesulfobacteriota bacterium]